MDIACKLKTERVELFGKTFELSCNFNVLGDIQAQFGDLNLVLNFAPMLATRVLLAAMCNDYANFKGWDKQDYTAREVGRELPTDSKGAIEISDKVLGLFRDAVLAKAVSKLDTADKTEPDGKN